MSWIGLTPHVGDAFGGAGGQSGGHSVVPLAIPGNFGILRAPMSNRAIWSMRKRHEWLATPLKKKRVKKATRLRCGLQDAMDRKGTAEKAQ
jgi:hypothetical protein